MGSDMTCQAVVIFSCWFSFFMGWLSSMFYQKFRNSKEGKAAE